MDNLREIILEQTLLSGASAVGIATTATLAGGPESADLGRVLPGAKSAISFAYALDSDLLEAFLAKKDRLGHERNNLDVNTLASGAALNLAGFLKMKGHQAYPIVANNYYRTDTPLGALDMKPDISLRYLAVRSGVGWFGLSGNVITPDYGAAVILGGVVTTAEFAPTEPLASADSYCNGCRLCQASCASGLMEEKAMTTVNLGGRDFEYSKRKSYLRCEYVCGGFTGLHPTGTWSTWSPGRFPIPESDEEFLPALMSGVVNYSQWPDMGGGYYHVLSPHKMFITCGNCQLVCHPDQDVRRRRHRMLKDGGVVVQDPEGTLVAMAPDQAQARLAEAEPRRRALYENLGQSNRSWRIQPPTGESNGSTERDLS